MRRTGQTVLAAVLCVGLAGCEAARSRQPYPPDPLLTRRKPVEGKLEKQGPALVARAEPAFPEPPATALASVPVDLDLPGQSRLARKSPSPGVAATPVARPSTPSNLPVSPAVRRRPGD